MSTYDRAVEAIENCAEVSPDQLVTAVLAYFSHADLIDFVERYIDDTIDQDEEETDDPDTDEDSDDEPEGAEIVDYDEDGDPVWERS